ncbi:Transthyretin-like family protein [Ancylostoma caninum]|uniref:Transthyretin-like family protein n=1 Tax=Ancylostoma caninum TaxID=29170 RepID=A0A368GXH9_ANCCA|nr:Transthyretin-like family protein [Ancylostoma caninum]
MQSVGVKGQLRCSNNPVGSASVELYDRELTLDDNLMTSTITNDKGFFSFRGSIRDIWRIEPYLKIWHKCNYKGVRTC